MLNEISMELAKQINDEIDPNKDDNDRVNEDVVEEEKRKFPRWAKIVTSVVAVLVSLTLVFVGTPWGRKQLKKIAVSIATEYAYGKMDYDDGSNVVVQDPVEDCDVTGDTDDSLSIIWGNSGYDGYARHDDNVINILLLGEEAIGSGVGRGRTDMVMIASMNVKNHTVKLTSIMRDTLVQIPEFQGKTYLDNKLNSAYEIGSHRSLFLRELHTVLLAGFNAFKKPRHIACKGPHCLHSLSVLQNLLRLVSVYHIPISA